MSLDDFATISLFYEDFFINSFEAELDLCHYKWRRKTGTVPKDRHQLYFNQILIIFPTFAQC